MKKINSLITDLESTDPKIRNEAAITLMDLGDSRAILPIIKAIKNPNNINYRGTSVYALSEFDMSEHVALLTSLVITGNYEVAAGSYQILDDIELNKMQKEQIRNQLSKINLTALAEEHNRDGYQYLEELLEC